jgi:hypothetical protein
MTAATMPTPVITSSRQVRRSRHSASVTVGGTNVFLLGCRPFA